MAWTRGPIIGRGSTATVALATVAGNLVAAKSCPLSSSSSSSLLQHEESILSALPRSPNIVSSFGHDITVDAATGKHIYTLFLEYVAGGPLSNLCGSLSDSTVKSYTKSLLEGLCFMHNNGYVHCDVKPHNILVTECRDAVKIADFGLAKRRFDEPMCSFFGTPLYMSPESVSRREYEAPSDIWALGCVVMEMMTGRPAWRDHGGVCGLLMRIGFGDELPEIPAEASEEARDFLSKCFVRDPEKRWTAEMLLKHPFVAVGDGCKQRMMMTSPKSVLDKFVSDADHEGCCFMTSKVMNCERLQVGDRIAMLATKEGRGREWWCSSEKNYDGWISVRGVCC